MTTPNTDIEVMKAMASLFRKKAAVMKALEGGIAKSGSNTHFNYKFMTASEIKHIVGGLFADNGLSLQMSGVATENAISKVERKEGPAKEVPILRIQFAISLCDMDTGAVEQSFWFGEAQATDDKAASKCATSALKYFLISNLMIADKEEDKRDTDRGPRRQQPAQTQQAAPAPASSNGASNSVPQWWSALQKDLRTTYPNAEDVQREMTKARRILDKGDVKFDSPLEVVKIAMKNEIPF